MQKRKDLLRMFKSDKYIDMKIPTLDEIRDHSDHNYKNIEWALSLQGESPEKPKKPILSNPHTSQDAAKYTSDLALYETRMVRYKEESDAHRNHCNEISRVIEEYIKDEAGISIVPEQYRDKLYRYAYSEGHSSGYYQVFNTLTQLIEIFE